MKLDEICVKLLNSPAKSEEPWKAKFIARSAEPEISDNGYFVYDLTIQYEDESEPDEEGLLAVFDLEEGKCWLSNNWNRVSEILTISAA